MSWRNVKDLRISTRGVFNLWVPQNNKIITINNIEIFGYCQGTINNPFYVLLEIFQNNTWTILGGVTAVQDRDFELHYSYPSEIKTDKGDGTNARLRITVQGGTTNKFKVSASVVGIEY